VDGFVGLLERLKTHPIIEQSQVHWSRDDFERLSMSRVDKYQDWLSAQAALLVRAIRFDQTAYGADHADVGNGLTAVDVELLQRVRQADRGTVAALLRNGHPDMTVARVAQLLRCDRTTIYRSPTFGNLRPPQVGRARDRRGVLNRDRDGGRSLEAIDDGPVPGEVDE
jgi:hypothetical protein